MSTHTKNNELPSVHNAVDIHAEAVSLTPFSVHGSNFVNLTFMYPIATNFLDSAGEPSSAKVELRKVGSTVMSKQGAERLYESLGQLLGKGDAK